MKNLFVGVRPRRIVLDFLLSVMISVLNCGFTHIMSRTVEEFAQESFLSFIASVFILLCTFAIFLFAQTYYQTITECVIENEICTYYMNQLYSVKPSVLKKSNTGYLSGVLNKTAVRQAEAYVCVVCAVPVDVAYILYFTAVLFRFDWRMSVAAVAVSIFGATFRSVIKGKMQPIGRLVADCEGKRTKLFTDVVANVETVQKMSAIEFMNTEACKVNSGCISAWRKWAVWNELSSALGKLVTFGFGPACLLIMYYMDKAYLAANLADVALVVAVSTQIPHNAKSFARTVSACCKFRDTASTLEEVVEPSNIRQESNYTVFEKAEIRDAQHHYVDTARNVDIKVRIPEFRINRGEKICVTGESGQGKTTLLNILSGCIESDFVTINGDKRCGRLNSIFVSQDVEIFDMSLRDNLCLGNQNITEARMEQLIKAVGLHDWFSAVGRNWDVPLGERGVFVSTGQRQRLNLCRGLLAADKDVYLLDEPTSNVDEETERLIVSLIQEYLHDKTVVIVTHRPLLRTICDYEYRFENGVLGERLPIRR